ncbi:uncharacterized protein LOC115590979 isoform X2 [Sparus aurata]|uniref:uncharacterized protein LOC115590979 isoform X2 n=1 Tax=Sparus aurata TaxID=8175 RepID=UPI0011C0E663|nr:uncharacterized protein LOC115590979 isoform X2 [Sparus aurata]
MEMWLKWSTPVFLAVAVAAMVISGQEPVTLDSVPREVTRPFGSPLILKCNLNTTGYLWVDWYFNPSECSVEGSRTLYSKVYNRSANTSTVVPDKRKVDDKDDELIWYKNNSGATYNDSGWYFCRVTIVIPKLIVNVSVGTKLVITTAPPRENFQLWHWIVLGVSAFILVVLPVMCILLRRRCRRSRAEDPVYANTRPVLNKQPSPRPKIPGDTLKTASSSQNLRNPSPKRYDDGRQRNRR